MILRRAIRTLAFLAFLLVIPSCPSGYAHEPVTVQFAPQWKVGETVQYQLVTTKSGSRKGSLVSSSSDIRIKVTGKTDAEYTLEWKYEDVSLETDGSRLKPAEQESISPLLHMSKGLTIRYTTDHRGVFKRMNNPAEVKSYFLKAKDTILRTIPDEEKKKAAEQFLNKLLANDAFIQNIALKEVMFFHNQFFYDQAYELGAKYESDVILPNPLQPQQPFTGKLHWVAVQENDRITLQALQELDKERSAQIISQIMEQWTRQMGGKPINEKEKVQSIAIRDEFSFTFRHGENWPERAAFSRSFSVLDQTRFESFTFTWQPGN